MIMKNEMNRELEKKASAENAGKACRFLEEAGTYYLATDENGQPRVRPFGTALFYKGRLYIQTGRVKPVSKQLAANPKAEICAMIGGSWIRITGELVEDPSREARVAMLEKYPDLKAMYDPDDGNTQVLYFRKATAVESSFTKPPVTYSFFA